MTFIVWQCSDGIRRPNGAIEVETADAASAALRWLKECEGEDARLYVQYPNGFREVYDVYAEEVTTTHVEVKRIL